MKYILVVDGQNIGEYSDHQSAVKAQENFELRTYEKSKIVEIKTS
jgi:hypothetical protein